MLKDRGLKKWGSLMLPEHVQLLKEALFEENEVHKPVLDEQEIIEMESLIVEGMEFNYSLTFSIFSAGFVQEIKGKTHYIDHLKKELRLIDHSGGIHFLSFDQLIAVQKS